MTSSEGRSFNRLVVPLSMGLAIAAIKIILSSIQYYYLEDYRVSTILFLVSLSVGIALLPVAGVWQKRRLGSTAALKDVFRAIFITILIAVTTSFVYDQVRLSMDPTIADRIYKGQIEYVKKLPHAAERLGELKKNYETDKTQKIAVFNLTTQLLSYIVWYSILGFIFALVISKNKALKAA